MGYSWQSFLWTADEFLIEYSRGPPLMHVKLFLAGHALELYLKAALSKMTGDPSQAVQFRHRVKQLFDKCQSMDPLFLPNYELRIRSWNV